MPLTRDESLHVVSDYLRAIEAKDAERVRALLHPTLKQHEYPNQLVKSGAERNLEDVLAGLARGAQVLTSERYEIEDALVDGDRVAARARWQGTLAIDVLGKRAGEVLEARFGVFFRLKDGLIVEQHNFDCFYV
jgi:ketosteroid isomerase-like protein